VRRDVLLSRRGNRRSDGLNATTVRLPSQDTAHRGRDVSGPTRLVIAEEILNPGIQRNGYLVEARD
jgi:hypothetical protein